MNTDDLRDLLNQDTPEGLDGEQVLSYAHRARTRRRLGAVGLGATAVVTAVAVAWGTGTLNRSMVDPALTASPVVSSTRSSPPTPPPDRPTSPIATPSGGASTAATATDLPKQLVTSLCQASTALPAGQRVGNLMAAARGLVVETDEARGVVRANGTVIFTPISPAKVLEAATDGRFVVFVVGRQTQPEDVAVDVYSWDSQDAGRAAKKLVSGQGAAIEVEDGWALVVTGTGQQEVHLLDLPAGTSSVVHSGAIQSASLVPDGRYTIVLAGGELAGTATDRPLGDDGRPVQMFAPLGTNGQAYVYNAVDGGEGRMMVWSPAMATPLEVMATLTNGYPPEVGRNFALVREMTDDAWIFRLVDLRTGAVLVLPSPLGLNTEYVLSAQDVLLVGPVNRRHAGTEPDRRYIDLGAVTLDC